MNSNYVLSNDYMNVFGVNKSPAMIWCIPGQTLPDPLTRVSDQTCHYHYNLTRSCIVLESIFFHHLDDSIILPLFTNFLHSVTLVLMVLRWIEDFALKMELLPSELFIVR